MLKQNNKSILFLIIMIFSVLFSGCISSSEYYINTYSNGKDYSIFQSNISGVPIFVKVIDKEGNTIDKFKNMENDFIIKLNSEYGEIIKTEKTEHGWKVIELGREYQSKYSDYKSNILWSPVSNGEMIPKDIGEIIVNVELYDISNNFISKEKLIIITEDGLHFSVK